VQFSPEEEEDFTEMARGEGFYERFARSVGPSIYGSLGERNEENKNQNHTDAVSIRYQEGHYMFALRRHKESSS
jgi:hypothetical protein